MVHNYLKLLHRASHLEIRARIMAAQSRIMVDGTQSRALRFKAATMRKRSITLRNHAARMMEG